jgi:CubicO group peptidase (beta-lactamase class C family)
MAGRRSFALVFVLLAGAISLSNQIPSANKAARIETLVARYDQFGYINGTVLVADQGKIIYARGLGYANFESQIPNTPQTKFGIASITKQFTALLVLQLAEEGKIHLDDPVSAYLPWYRKDTGARMNIEQLLRHTSGLPPDYDSPEFSESAEAARRYEPQPFAQKFCQPNLASAPGTRWDYSNCGYVLLGLVLEQVTGKPFDDLLHDRLLVPLALNDTGIDRNDLAQRGGASGYVRHAGPRYTPGPYIDRSHIFAAGAMYSTVEDLLRWNQALSGSPLISARLRDRIFQPGMHDWAYGWFVAKIPAGEPGAGHMRAEMRGDMPGNFFAWIIRYPEQDAAIIVLRNGYGSTENLEGNLQAILFDAEPHWPHRSPKDLFARAWQVPLGWAHSHPALAAILSVLALIAIWQIARRRGQSSRRYGS